MDRRRSGIIIMLKLMSSLGSLAFVIIVALINGTLGFLSASGVTVFGAVAIAKLLGELGLCATVSIPWWGIALGAVGCGLIRGVLRYFEQYSNHFIAFKLLAILRHKAFASLRRLGPSKVEQMKKGNLLSLLTADIETLEVFYAHTMSPVLIAVLSSLAYFLFIYFLGGLYLSLVAIFAYVLLGVIVPTVSSKVLKSSGVRYRNQLAGFNSYYLDSLKGVKETIVEGNVESRKAEIERQSTSLLSTIKATKRKNSRAAAITEVCVALTMALATAVALIGYIYLGQDLGLLIIALVCFFSSFGPVLALSALPGNLTQTFASGERLLNLLEEKPSIEEVKGKNDIDFRKLEVKDLSFAYEGEEDVIKNANLTAELGQIIGIVGPSGCGKSTLLKLLLRFNKKEAGQILYDGIDVDEVNTSSLYENVAVVFQDTYLFDGTIAENIALGNPSASKEEILKAVDEASLKDFIDALPQGLDTKVGQTGEGISSGEKQRIGLARAFLSKAKLILLDEPTSNVDSLNEGMILASLVKAKKDRAIILVSHRESTMAISDIRYIAHDGMIQKGE